MLKKHVILAFCLLALLLPAVAGATNAGDRLPAFSGVDMDGNKVDLVDIIGKKPVMLVFWSSWCGTCKKEIPKINELVKKYRARGMEFIGINVGMNDTEEKARNYIKKYKITYPVVFDKTGELSEKYEIPKVLTVLVAQKDGTVVMKFLSCPKIDEFNFRSLQQLPPSEEELKIEFPPPPLDE